MGISISAKNSSYCFDMGYGGFFNLRKNIALCLDEDFGKNYENIAFCHSSEDFEESDRIANEIINKKRLDEEYADVIDFLYDSDCDGKISYKVCRKIFDLIEGVDFGKKRFRYAGVASESNDYEEFKVFLKECYSHRRNMIWR